MPDSAELDSSEVRRRLRAGIAIDFGKRPASLTPDEWDARRRVEAKWISELADDGGTISVALSITGACITGDLTCLLLTFSRAVIIRSCDVERPASFANCHFQGPLDLSGSIWFEGLTLESAQVDGMFNFTGSRSEIRKSASFMRAVFKDGFSVRGSQLERADFFCASFGKEAQFQPVAENGGWKVTRFLGSTRFMDARFAMAASFGSSEFQGDADFTRIVVSGPAFFRPYRPNAFNSAPEQLNAQFAPVLFAKEAIFFAAVFQAGADFTAARFQGEADFRWSNINRFALFGPSSSRIPTTFHGAANFFGLQVNGRLILEGAQFEKDVTFEASQVTGNVLMRSSFSPAPVLRTNFKGSAIFLDAVVTGSADFSGACFEGPANFVRMRIGGAAFFKILLPGGPKTEFRKEADFSDASFAGIATFECTQFQAVRFRRTVFGGITYFGGARFTGEANFSDSDFRQDVYWNPFNEAAQDVVCKFESAAAFARTRFGGSVNFIETYFCRADFWNIKVSGNMQFRDATLQDRADLYGAQIGGDLRLQFQQPSTEVALILNDVTVKGALIIGEAISSFRTYQKTLSVSELELDVRLMHDMAAAYNTHTLLQFEKAYRFAGDERSGDKVYIETRKVERRMQRLKLFRKDSRMSERLDAIGALVLDSLRRLFRYGLPSVRVLAYSLLVFFCGVILLRLPGALEPRQPSSSSALPHRKDEIGRCGEGNWPESFWTMAAATVPGEAAKSISQCSPSAKPVRFINWPYNVCVAIISWVTVILFSLFVAGYARFFKYKG